jgi:hypothetical protein
VHPHVQQAEISHRRHRENPNPIRDSESTPYHNGVRKNPTTVPAATATQFIVTLSAKRFVLAIDYSVRRSQDTIVMTP